MREQDSDRLEQFFRKATSKPDVSFDENDWKKLEARLDAQDALGPGDSRPERKVAIASAVTAILLLSLMFLVNSGDDPGSVSGPVASAGQASEEAEPFTDLPTDDKAVPGGQIEESVHEVPNNKNEESVTAFRENEGEAEQGSVGRVEETGREDATDAAEATVTEPGRNGKDGVAMNRSDEPVGPERGAIAASHKVVDATDEQLFRDLINISTAKAGKIKQKAIVELPGAEEAETGEAESLVRAEDHSDQTDHGITPRLSLLLSFAPDFSSTSMSQYSAPGKAFGAVLLYHVKNRWSLSVGVVKNNKQYTGDGEDYSPPKGYWKYYTNGIIPSSIEGSCTVLEFPLMVQYAPVNNRRSRLLVGAGASSYLMWNESYRYNFDEPNPGAKEGWSSDRRSRFMFNMINFTLAYEREVVPGFMIGIEPYVKIPVEEIGWSNLKLFSTGASLTLRYTILRKRKPAVPNRSRGPD